MNQRTPHRITGRAWALSATLLALFASSPSAANDWITVNPLQIDLLAGYYDYNRAYDQEEYNRDWWEAGVRLEQEGHILHPGILKFSYYLEPRYRRGAYSDSNRAEDTSDDFLGYFLSIDILKGAILPVDGRVVASNSSSVSTGTLGRRSEYETQMLSAEMVWKWKPFPVVFLAQERSIFSISQTAVGSSAFLRDDVERTLSAKGESTKLSLLLERRELDDQVPDRANDFTIDRFYARHQFLWGRNSELTSRFEYWDRRGFNAYTRTEWSQIFNIYHAPSLESTATYRFRTVGNRTSTDLFSATYRLEHRLYRNLTTSGGLVYDRRKSPNQLETREQVELKVSYQKSELWGAGVGLFLGGNYGRIDRDSERGVLEVVDEPQAVPISGQIFLGNTFVIGPTIVVTSADSAIVYEAGLDYEVILLGNGITQLSVLPQGRIEVGQTILVSYTAAILPSVEFDRISRTSSFSIGFRGFSLNYQDDAVRNDVISGAAASLYDTRNRTVRLAYSREISRLSINLSAERRYIMLANNESTTNSANQNFSLRISPRANIGLNLNQSFTETSTQTALPLETLRENVDAYSGNLYLNWRPMAGLVINPVITAYKRELNRGRNTVETSDDSILSASLRINWIFRKLSMNLIYTHNDRTYSGSAFATNETVEDTIQFNMRRRF